VPRPTPGRTLAQQYFDARQHFDRVELRRPTVRVHLAPTIYSPCYLVSIWYRPDLNPRIRVLDPQIPRDTRHLYPSGNLCVYWHEWDNTMGFGTELIPWIAEWLLTYEIWQVTRVWGAPAHEATKE